MEMQRRIVSSDPQLGTQTDAAAIKPNESPLGLTGHGRLLLRPFQLPSLTAHLHSTWG
jgi:hypothetical protein